MRFLQGGADIPEELIEAARDGNVVFLCGAGVSLRVGLPSFKRLTEQVYERLGEASDGEPAERNALASNEFDRALRSLEKRTHRPGTESRVRKAVTDLLAAPGTDFPDHRALLQLSKDAEGRPRLLTTNFDTLFERAAAAAGITDVPSHAGKSIPAAGRERDYGIFHLHGRIGDPTLSLETTDLVLTSADFGDAYLRGGWASEYIEDRMRLGILVLVGYAAEDAAMRLLLETLDADRDRFRDLKDIYAIEKETADSASLWKAKGIKPVEFASYDAIYRTLSEWALYVANPAEYGQRRVKAILTGAPGGAP
jgi:SIR2-like domain